MLFRITLQNNHIERSGFFDSNFGSRTAGSVCKNYWNWFTKLWARFIKKLTMNSLNWEQLSSMYIWVLVWIINKSRYLQHRNLTIKTQKHTNFSRGKTVFFVFFEKVRLRKYNINWYSGRERNSGATGFCGRCHASHQGHAKHTTWGDMDTMVERDYQDLLDRTENGGNPANNRFNFKTVKKLNKVNKKVDLLWIEGLAIVNATQMHHLEPSTLRMRPFRLVTKV